MKNFFIYWSYLIYYYIDITIEQFKASTEDEKLISRAKKYALLTHHGVRQRYDKKYPYYYHLKMVSNNAIRFKSCLTHEQFITAYLICLFHDLIEDCRLTYNDVKQMWGKEVADGVFVCTDLRGKNRKERHGPQFIKELKESFLGTYSKLCDVFANMEMGMKTGSSMLDMYRKDYPYTKRDLYRSEFDHIFHAFESELI